MARDAQLAGDRVQTEYYLQFADHYFRVLGESRSRFEEQNPRRQRDDDFDDDEGDDEMAEADAEASADERRGARRALQPSQPADAATATTAAIATIAAIAKPARESRAGRTSTAGETIPFDVLPPAIGRDEPDADEAAEEEPRRRAAAPAPPRPAEGDDEIAPAA